MGSEQIKVVIVDSHPIVREGLKQFLEADDTCKVVAEASDGTAALFACENHDHDILLMNATLSGNDVFETVRTFKKKHATKKVLICYLSEDVNALQELHKNGTDGFIGQEATSGEYAAAVKTVLEGGNFFSKNLADIIFNENRITADNNNAYGLTRRELDILLLLANGLCNKEIANKYNLSVRTVETHRLNIRRKTKSNTLSDLIRIARSLGLSNLGGVLPELHGNREAIRREI